MNRRGFIAALAASVSSTKNLFLPAAAVIQPPCIKPISREIPPETMAAINRIIRHEAMMERQDIAEMTAANARMDDYFAGIWWGSDRA